RARVARLAVRAVDDAVAAPRDGAVVQAAVVVVHVAVVAELAGIDDAVAAAEAGAAVGAAVIAALRVAVVADLAGLDVLDAVAADLGRLARARGHVRAEADRRVG